MYDIGQKFICVPPTVQDGERVRISVIKTVDGFDSYAPDLGIWDKGFTAGAAYHNLREKLDKK